jgi:hypothetical protein
VLGYLSEIDLLKNSNKCLEQQLKFVSVKYGVLEQ